MKNSYKIIASTLLGAALLFGLTSCSDDEVAAAAVGGAVGAGLGAAIASSSHDSGYYYQENYYYPRYTKYRRCYVDGWGRRYCDYYNGRNYNHGYRCTYHRGYKYCRTW